jgi:hypothetical protein
LAEVDGSDLTLLKLSQGIRELFTKGVDQATTVGEAGVSGTGTAG